MKINKYWSKTKRTYIRKNKFNKTYRGGKTLHTKETEKAFGKFLIILTVFAYCSAGAYSLASNTRTITIQGGGAVSPETAKQALREMVVGADNSPTTAPVDFTGIPYMEKEKISIEKVKQEIIDQARYYGVNVETALRVGRCESNYRWWIDNLEDGDASGVFQFRNLTWINYCEGDVYNYQDNIRCFMKIYPKYPHWWECK